MNDELGSILPSTAALGAVAVIALFLTVSRGWAAENRTQVRGAVRVAVITVLFQATHFAEELATGFQERFPALFGFVPMPLRGFVLFNIAWLALWSLCVWGLAARQRAVLSPIAGVLGILLLRRLLRVTQSVAFSPGAA